MLTLAIVLIVFAAFWVLAATMGPAAGKPRFLPRLVWDFVMRRRLVLVPIVLALLAVPSVRDEWGRRHAHCTTGPDIAVDFNGDGGDAAERWTKMESDAQRYCPPGQWDRSKIDLTKI